ncbi:MAG: glycosyltransferase [Bacteriovoracaceae bacterium]|nr:glycosyltransferase [Bacteriovoracaceae bacterium]
MKVTVVIPTYNEAENLPIIVEKIERIVLSKYLGDILIVDDYSPDGTAGIARKLNEKYKNISVMQKKKEGIGAATRLGYNNVKGDLIVSTDADLSFDIEDMLRLISKIEEGYDFVTGSRYTEKEKYEKSTLKTHIKSFISKNGNKMIRLLSGVNISDFSANFRAMKKDVWRDIKTQDNTNSIFFEMIIKTAYKGYKICEIDVEYKERLYGQSKLSLHREALKFFWKVIKYSSKYRVKNG